MVIVLIYRYTGDTQTLVTYSMQHKTNRRYTICQDCNYDLYSPYHDMHHRIWRLRQIANLSNIQIQDDEKSIIVESEYQGKKYRGIMYPVKEEDIEMQ